MITRDTLAHRQLVCEVFKEVTDFLDVKSRELTKDAKESGDTARENAYPKVHIYFLERHDKMMKEMKTLKARYERRKSRQRQSNPSATKQAIYIT